MDVRGASKLLGNAAGRVLWLRRGQEGPLLPLLFLLLLLALAQFEGHHPPGQVLHALLVRQLLLGLAEELPDLGGQGILALHLLDAARRRGARLEGREQRGVEDMVF